MLDPHGQVLDCYQQVDALRNALAEVRALAADPSVSAVVVTSHEGAEYVDAPIPPGNAPGPGARRRLLGPWETPLQFSQTPAPHANAPLDQRDERQGRP